nr:NAD(P)/FAD-dependent oxidoreductase [Sphingobium sp. EM0848]
MNDHCDVIIAGGGFGGLSAGARLREAGCETIRIIEEGGDFGGTWYWNRYPGAMCDIEAHIYLPLLEELHYAPKHRYAYAPEMLEHSQRIGRHYGLYEKACFQTAITAMRWQEKEKRWLVETNRGDRMTADFVVLACGRQSLPKLPNIPGIDTFEGHTFHSSRWDYGYTGGDSDGGLVGLGDKRVAVVGTGATALQVVPEVAKWAKELFVFQRTPSTVGVRAQQETAPDWIDMNKVGWQKARRENFQKRSVGMIPKDQDEIRDGWTAAFHGLGDIGDVEVSAALGRALTKEEKGILAEVADLRLMKELRERVENEVGDSAVAEKLKPYYRWFCKRPGFHDEYLQSFNRPNVHLVDTNGQGIEGFTKDGVQVNGDHYDVDCVVFATSGIPSFLR